MDDSLYRLCQNCNNSRLNQDHNDQFVEQWRTPIWTRSKHWRAQHFFLVAQLYLIFYKKFIAIAFESSIIIFRVFSFCPAHLLGIILSLLNEQQRNFICYQKGQTKHFMIYQKKFQQAMQGKMTNPRSLFWKNTNNKKERTHKTTIF